MGRLFNRVITVILVSGTACSESNHPIPSIAKPQISYVHDLVNSGTGLVSSREGECFTTLYKNSLAAMVFLREGNRAAAEKVFDVFNNYLMTEISFVGFPKDWNPCTGLPLGTNYWEGDNAFLLLALNYYKQITGSTGKYAALSQALIGWMIQRANACDQIVAEGVANMYASLKPFDSDPAVHNQLIKLRACFFSQGQISSVDFSTVLDHTVRGSLVFGDNSGMAQLENFIRTETWDHAPAPAITAYSAFAGDSFINLEISAQLLLTERIWNQTAMALILQTQLEKLWLRGNQHSTSMGLPYFLTNHGFDNAQSIPIIDPTAYMIFYYYGFNPFAPGKKCADCN